MSAGLHHLTKFGHSFILEKKIINLSLAQMSLGLIVLLVQIKIIGLKNFGLVFMKLGLKYLDQSPKHSSFYVNQSLIYLAADFYLQALFCSMIK